LNSAHNTLFAPVTLTLIKWSWHTSLPWRFWRWGQKK